MRRPQSAGVDPPVIYLITIPHFSVYAVVEILIISSPLLIANEYTYLLAENPFLLSFKDGREEHC
jgi:hypothetical protein